MSPRSLSKATLARRVCLCSGPRPPRLEHNSLHTPYSLEGARHSAIPSTFAAEGKMLPPAFGGGDKGFLGKSCAHWAQKPSSN